jgi:hypothetical protein
MQLAPDGQHSPPQHCLASSQQSSPQMVMPVGQQRPSAVQAPLQQPSIAQMVMNSAQGLGAGVVMTGAWVVAVGGWRMGGLGRLPCSRASAFSLMAAPAMAVPLIPNKPLRMARLDAPLPIILARLSNFRSSIYRPPPPECGVCHACRTYCPAIRLLRLQPVRFT